MPIMKRRRKAAIRQKMKSAGMAGKLRDSEESEGMPDATLNELDPKPGQFQLTGFLILSPAFYRLSPPRLSFILF